VLRGQIEHRERAKQLIDFGGLRFGKITPTDIDGMIEYKGKAFVYYELKYLNAPVPFGQKIAFEQSVKSHIEAGQQAIVMIVEHEVHDCDEDIMANDCLVREFYQNPKEGWVLPTISITAFDLTQQFLNQV